VLSANEGKYQRFAQIVDQEYHEIIASNTPVAHPVKVTGLVDDPPSSTRGELRQLMLIGVALAAGALTGRMSRGGPHGRRR